VGGYNTRRTWYRKHSTGAADNQPAFPENQNDKHVIEVRIMNSEQMRGIVTSAYQGDAWKKKVKGMSDDKVFAIYRSLQARKKVKL
jgi:transposase